jgi:hypothetical protein
MMQKETDEFTSAIAATLNLFLQEVSKDHHTFVDPSGMVHPLQVSPLFTADLKALESLSGLRGNTCFYCGVAYSQAGTPERWGLSVPQNTSTMERLGGCSSWKTIIPDNALHSRLRVASAVMNMYCRAFQFDDDAVLYPVVTAWLLAQADFGDRLKKIWTNHVRRLGKFNPLLNSDPRPRVQKALKDLIKEQKAISDSFLEKDFDAGVRKRLKKHQLQWDLQLDVWHKLLEDVKSFLDPPHNQLQQYSAADNNDRTALGSCVASVFDQRTAGDIKEYDLTSAYPPIPLYTRFLVVLSRQKQQMSIFHDAGGPPVSNFCSIIMWCSAAITNNFPSSTAACCLLIILNFDRGTPASKPTSSCRRDSASK